MAEELALVVADDLAGNQPGKRLNDWFRELLWVPGGMSSVDHRQRVPHVLGVEARHG
jgi:hypothetical protein